MTRDGFGRLALRIKSRKSSSFDKKSIRKKKGWCQDQNPIKNPSEYDVGSWPENLKPITDWGIRVVWGDKGLELGWKQLREFLRKKDEEELNFSVKCSRIWAWILQRYHPTYLSKGIQMIQVRKFGVKQSSNMMNYACLFSWLGELLQVVQKCFLSNDNNSRGHSWDHTVCQSLCQGFAWTDDMHSP